VKVTDVKVMLVRGLFDWPMVKIETDAGVTGFGESYWGAVKDIMLGSLRTLIIGEDPLDIDRLYTKMITRTGGSGSLPAPLYRRSAALKSRSGTRRGRSWERPSRNSSAASIGKACALTGHGGRKIRSIPICREFAEMLKSHPYGFQGIKCDFLRTPDPNEPSTGTDRARPASECGCLLEHSRGAGRRLRHRRALPLEFTKRRPGPCPGRGAHEAVVAGGPLPPDFSESW
jgi:hypothetical protein